MSFGNINVLLASFCLRWNFIYWSILSLYQMGLRLCVLVLDTCVSYCYNTENRDDMVPPLLSLATPNVVNTKTSGAVNNDTVGITATLRCQWNSPWYWHSVIFRWLIAPLNVRICIDKVFTLITSVHILTNKQFDSIWAWLFSTQYYHIYLHNVLCSTLLNHIYFNENQIALQLSWCHMVRIPMHFFTEIYTTRQIFGRTNWE